MADFDFKDAELSPGFRAVEAGAGTGKTYSLIWVVVRLLLERRKQAKEILMVTFTDAAALEMRQRLREFLEAIEKGTLAGDQRRDLLAILAKRCDGMEESEARRLAGKALNQLGRMSITTIHGFCQSAFAEHAVNAGFAPMEGAPIDGGVVAEAIAADWFRSGRSADSKLSDIARAVRVLMADPDCDVSALPEGDALRRFVATRLEESAVVTFDDLILRLRNALVPRKSEDTSEMDDRLARAAELTAQLRQSYSCCLIDEFQDTDAAQWEIFSHLFAKDSAQTGALLMVVGDPKQAIYGFRGADLHTYLNAVRQSEGGAGSTLRTNYRSTPAMVAFFNALFGHKGYFGDGGIGYALALPNGAPLTSPPAEKPVRLIAGKEAYAVAAEVKRLLATQPEGKSVGVLVRSNRLGNALHRALVEQGTPAALESTQSVYETTTAFQAALLLRAVLRPGDASARKALLLSRPALFGNVPPDALDIGADQSNAAVLKAHNTIARWLSDCRDVWDKFGFTACWERATRLSPGDGIPSVRESLARSIFRARALIDLAHIGEHLASVQSSRRLDPEQLLAYLQQRVEQTASDEEGQDDDAAPDECLRLESAKPQVVVQTIHKSKGLEYDSVVLVIQRPKNAPSFPGNVLRQGCTRTLTMGKPKAARNRQPAQELLLQDRDENARLLYVAITRAKQRLTVFNDTLSGDIDKEYGFHKVLRACGVDPATWTTQNGGEGPGTPLQLSELVEMAEPAKRPKSERGQARPARELTPPVDKRGPDGHTLQVEQRSGKLPSVRGSSSFSSLTKRHKLDKFAPPPDRSEDEDDDETEVEAPSQGLLIPDAIKGTGFGIVIHELLEDIDFEKGDGRPEALAADIANRLEAEQVALPEGHADWSGIAGSLAGSCTAWLDAGLLTEAGKVGHRVRDIRREKCLHEVRFAMRGKCDADRLDDLSAAFRAEFKDHAAMANLKVGQLDLDGILTGVLDLAYEHEGKFYVLDWKTNYLGDAPGDYDEAGLADAVAKSAYHLQYSLYTAALDLHLRNALGDRWTYDPKDAKPGQACFGGVQYLFLRAFGLKPEGLGCHFRRPSKGFIATIQKILTQ